LVDTKYERCKESTAYDWSKQFDPRQMGYDWSITNMRGAEKVLGVIGQKCRSKTDRRTTIGQ
jgi:hypothetical protein